MTQTPAAPPQDPIPPIPTWYPAAAPSYLAMSYPDVPLPPAPTPSRFRSARRPLLLVAVLLIVAIPAAIGMARWLGPDRDAAGQLTTGADVVPAALKRGDCVDKLPDSEEVRRMPAVPCSRPHEGEVFAVFDLPKGEWPGNATALRQAGRGCQSRLAAYSKAIARKTSPWELYVLHPTADSWRRAERTVVCVLSHPDGPRTGSVRG